MNPGDDPEIVRDLLDAEQRPLLLAGHLPHLPDLFDAVCMQGFLGTAGKAVFFIGGCHTMSNKVQCCHILLHLFYLI